MRRTPARLAFVGCRGRAAELACAPSVYERLAMIVADYGLIGLLVLIVGIAYAWRTGGLEWE